MSSSAWTRLHRCFLVTSPVASWNHLSSASKNHRTWKVLVISGLLRFKLSKLSNVQEVSGVQEVRRSVGGAPCSHPLTSEATKHTGNLRRLLDLILFPSSNTGGVDTSTAFISLSLFSQTSLTTRPPLNRSEQISSHPRRCFWGKRAGA